MRSKHSLIFFEQRVEQKSKDPLRGDPLLLRLEEERRLEVDSLCHLPGL